MSNIEFTKSQKAAIDFGQGNLLVSASAGSGKTATLSARVLRLLSDEEVNASIDRMLIVTFTKASANDLKTKIRKDLKEKIKANPDNKYLKIQLAKLSNAQIGTIHSYCLRLIKSHFNELNLSPEMRICDEIESEILKKEVMRNVVNSYYAGIEKGTTSSLLADTLNTSKSEETLDDILLDFVKSLVSHGYNIDKLDEYESGLREAQRIGFLTSPQGLAIKEHILQKTKHYKVMLNYYYDQIKDFNPTHSYLSNIQEMLDYINKLESLLNNGNYAEIQKHLETIKFKSLNSKISENDRNTLTENFQECKKEITKKLKERIKGKFFLMTSDEIDDSIKITADICHEAKPLINDFLNQYAKIKKERGILDFSDLEYYALGLLYDNNNNLTNIAEIEAQKFDYVFIDEYQDTNYIQDKIFAAIGSKYGRFLVGDIKQSIYRFRGAESNIFASYRNNWDGLNNSIGNSIFLQENFRCDTNVVAFTNLVSNYIFKHSTINYTSNDDLVHAKPKDDDDCSVEIDLLSTKHDDEKSIISEPEFVAMKIKKLLDENHQINANDIAIILRATTKAHEYEKALQAYGIKSNISTSEAFFEQPEILLAICLLNAVDNPNRDEYLCGAMRSPIFGFTTDELIEIRTATVDTTFWQAVKAYNNDLQLKEKCNNFIQELNSLRKNCNQLTADKAVRLIFQKTNIYELNFNNQQAKSNLLLLYDMARKYESGVFAGLYGFLSHIQESLNKDNTSVESAPANDNNSVNITTIHKSKGLEYKVCFLSEMSHQFNTDDTKNNLIYDTEFGLSTKIADETGLANYDTPVRQAAAIRITNAMIEEEMRILYVALTRAKSKLFVTASDKDPYNLIQKSQANAKFSTREKVFSTKNYITWILDSIYENRFVPPIYCDVNVINQEKAEELKIASEAMISSDYHSLDNIIIDDNSIDSEQWDEFLNNRLNFKYKNNYKRLIPSTLSISQLRPDSLDTNTTLKYKVQRINNSERHVPIPSFLSGEPGYSASTIGTAFHTFLEYCDFENVCQKGIKFEIDRLIHEEFITSETAKLLNINQLNQFFKSEIFNRMKQAKMIKREFEFVSTISASELTMKKALKAKFDSTNEKALLHGVIDCIFEDANGNFVILDYKTDRFSEPYISEDKDKLVSILLSRHQDQLKYYAKIASEIFDHKINEIYIYSFSLNELIAVSSS